MPDNASSDTGKYNTHRCRSVEGHEMSVSVFVCVCVSTCVCESRMREWPEFGGVTCLAIACPSCMTLDLACSCSSYVTTIINGADLIPTVSAGACCAMLAVLCVLYLLCCACRAQPAVLCLLCYACFAMPAVLCLLCYVCCAMSALLRL